jgi:diguanylate cyclase (GGDEF)-like protein
METINNNSEQPYSLEELNQKITSLEQEVQKLTQENQLLKQQAVKDPQTELLNERGLQEAEENMVRGTLRDIAEGKDEERNIRTIYFDLNNLKEVNDTQGHEQGDILIGQMAEYVKKLAGRTGDIAARCGGDEFVLFLRNDTRNAEEYLNIQREKYPNLKFSAGVVDLDLNDLYKKVVSEVGGEQKGYHLIQEKMLTELRNSQKIADIGMYEAKKLNKEKSSLVFTGVFQ